MNGRPFGLLLPPTGEGQQFAGIRYVLVTAITKLDLTKLEREAIELVGAAIEDELHYLGSHTS